MSSTYRAICMSHDPAIEIDLDGLKGGNVNLLDTALLLSSVTRGQHPGCDMLIGRYSYSLVEVTCPPSRLGGPHGCPVFHSEPNSVDIGWLRLLYHARQASAPKPLSETLAMFDHSCWSPRRVERLMRLIGDEYATNLEPLDIVNASAGREVRDPIARDFMGRQDFNPIGDTVRKHGLSAVIYMSTHQRAELRDALASADRSEGTAS